MVTQRPCCSLKTHLPHRDVGLRRVSEFSHTLRDRKIACAIHAMDHGARYEKDEASCKPSAGEGPIESMHNMVIMIDRTDSALAGGCSNGVRRLFHCPASERRRLRHQNRVDVNCQFRRGEV
jgi:hypothetical protein